MVKSSKAGKTTVGHAVSGNSHCSGLRCTLFGANAEFGHEKDYWTQGTITGPAICPGEEAERPKGICHEARGPQLGWWWPGSFCCFPNSPCGLGKGDCNTNNDCEGSLECGENNCEGDFFTEEDDCCFDPGCIIDDETDYSYHDIPNGRRQTESQQECADFAASTQGKGQGLFWTWNKSSKTCMVKSSKAGKTTVGHAVSGNSLCGTA